MRFLRTLYSLLTGGSREQGAAPSGQGKTYAAPPDIRKTRFAMRGQSNKECGFLVFQHTGEVIRAEQFLRLAGFDVAVMGPPPELRTGCDMVIVFDIIHELAVRRELDVVHLSPLQVVPVRGSMLEPISLYQVKDFGQWYMVRAANMKITVEKKTGIIVNVSGGGCPDVPYLAALLTGQSIAGVEEPRVKGQTLCAYSLQHAFEEARRLWNG